MSICRSFKRCVVLVDMMTMSIVAIKRALKEQNWNSSTFAKLHSVYKYSRALFPSTLYIIQYTYDCSFQLLATICSGWTRFHLIPVCPWHIPRIFCCCFLVQTYYWSRLKRIRDTTFKWCSAHTPNALKGSKEMSVNILKRFWKKLNLIKKKKENYTRKYYDFVFSISFALSVHEHRSSS